MRQIITKYRYTCPRDGIHRDIESASEQEADDEAKKLGWQKKAPGVWWCGRHRYMEGK